jgi:hypothetical protein
LLGDVGAIKELLDRGLGKVKQEVDMHTTNVSLTPQDFIAMLRGETIHDTDTPPETH